MKRLGLIGIMVLGLINFAVANQANKIDDILSKIDTTPKVEFSEEECTPEMRALTNCKITKPSYDMPGGKGSLDRILGRDPKTGKVESFRDVSYDEGMLKRAKDRYNKSLEDLDKAKKELEIATQNKNTQKIENAKENLQDKERDVELYKVKVVDLEARKKEAEKKEE
ncbi:hypothetical protein [Campylobacter suis]|uniref:Uncharacterized protein n=1 Tax=Campylobacter suis TaxID=2790657 RepID=A0ABM8Q5L5_9BACT|nr:hypothetical protein [Campylobacter suis]CAD7288078.1 hypothetical protein LMG8286_01127 [Campylobacter suis]